MRIFVAGATGAIGRRLVPMLVEAGHEVAAMTRSAARGEPLAAVGAQPVVCDAFDADGLAAAVEAARPEVVVHQLTAIPTRINPRRLKRDFAVNDRLRTEGTGNLVAAAQRAGARRMVAQSIAFAYAPRGDLVKSEEAELYLDAPKSYRRTIEAVAELERRVTGAGDMEGLVLRYGFFYGPATSYGTDGHFTGEVRRRRLPIVGSGDSVFSWIHVDDAARATVAALERGAPGIYNVVDDDPAPLREWLPVLAQALRAPVPRRVPVLLARMIGGAYLVDYMTRLRGARNDKAKRELGWAPQLPTWREGFRSGLS